MLINSHTFCQNHATQIVAIESGNPLFYPAFWAATDVIHSLPTMPLRNSAVHRILEEKPIEGVCLRLRSGPETVSRYSHLAWTFVASVVNSIDF